MNKYICLGIMGMDPEIIANGCKLRIAVNSIYKEEPLWISVFVFGVTSENCMKYKKKGDKILVEGRLEISKGNNLVVIAEKIQFI